MPDIDDINERITQTATDGIDSTNVGGQFVKVMSVDEQIKAAAYVAAQTAAPGSFGLRFSKLVPPECG